MKAYIYILIDPRTGEVRYVGKAKNLHNRLYRHLYYSKRDTCSKCKAWIRSLANNGMVPIMQEIDQVEDWVYWEQFYISYFRFIGSDLLNMTPGGNAPPVFYGKENPMCRADVVEKFRETVLSKPKQIIQYNADGWVMKIWYSINDIMLGFEDYDKRKIQRTCNKGDNQKMAYGFRWEYAA